MRPIKPNARRRSLWRSVLLAIGAIAIGGAGTVGALAAFKVIDLSRLWGTRPDHPAGYVGIPLSARSIPAYTEVTRDYLLNPKTGELVLKWVAPNDVPKGIITDLSKILKRVTARDKPAVYYFLESDFLPEGTSPGPAGGTPLGKRAITLDATKLKGVHELKEGDVVDLLASVAVDMPGAGHSNSGRMGTNFVASPDALLLPKRGLVNVLVHDGVVVSPVKIRNMPTTVSSLTQGATTHTMPVQEIVLAVAPEEVRLVAEAIDLKYEILCAVHSGRPVSRPSPEAGASAGGTSQGAMSQASAKAIPGRPSAAAADKASPASESAKNVNGTKSESPVKNQAATDVTPGLDPMAGTRCLEVMIGNQRQFMLFSGPGNSPVVAGQSDASTKAADAAPGTVAAPGAVEEKKE